MNLIIKIMPLSFSNLEQFQHALLLKAFQKSTSSFFISLAFFCKAQT